MVVSLGARGGTYYIHIHMLQHTCVCVCVCVYTRRLGLLICVTLMWCRWCCCCCLALSHISLQNGIGLANDWVIFNTSSLIGCESERERGRASTHLRTRTRSRPKSAACKWPFQCQQVMVVRILAKQSNTMNVFGVLSVSHVLILNQSEYICIHCTYTYICMHV